MPRTSASRLPGCSFRAMATWTAFETSGADPNRNVNWSFSFVPPEEGVYELLVRAECADGRLTPESARVRVEARGA